MVVAADDAAVVFVEEDKESDDEDELLLLLEDDEADCDRRRAIEGKCRTRGAMSNSRLPTSSTRGNVLASERGGDNGSSVVTKASSRVSTTAS